MTGVAQRVRALDPQRRLGDVAARLLEIERERDGYRDPDRAARRRVQRRPDGVACFNYLYLSRDRGRPRLRWPRFEDAGVRRAARGRVRASSISWRTTAARAGEWVSKAWAAAVRAQEREGHGADPVRARRA